MDLFVRAKSIALGLVKTWLPDGRQEGQEWKALNPTRADKNIGSFSVNLSTGKWAEFNGDGSGNDCISLYAYLNRDRLQSLVLSLGAKNIEGRIQAEAAKEILSTYDPTYFPSAEDLFVPTAYNKDKGGFWDGWSSTIIDNASLPVMDLAWFEKKWGKKERQWDFWRGTKFIMRVCRFKSGKVNKNGKLEKEDRPFTVWTNGNEFKWRAKSPQELYPLWNFNKLEEFPNKKVLLSEGQKDPEILDKLLDDYICTGWYGGAGNALKSDWSILTGREVWYLFDADAAGRRAINLIKKIAIEYNIKLHLVFPPSNCEKGWSLADQVASGWSADRIEKYITENTNDSEELQQKFIDDNPFDFKILGYSGENITFYPFGSKKVIKFKATSINKSSLVVLMDRKLWGDFFAKPEGGIAWDAAVNFVLRKAEQQPVFNPSIVRGSGAWYDEGRLIINTGEKLIVDGKIKDLHENTGSLIFERSSQIPYELGNEVSNKNLKFVIDMVHKLPWKDPICGDLFLGWILLAPFGGALNWRPHIWIIGAKGSGKSWILTNIAVPLVGSEFGVLGFGSSTPAGIRGALGNSAKALILEEMESDNQKFAEYIDQNLKALREGTSGRGEGFATLHQSMDGEGKQWRVQSMAMCASIGANIRHGADKSRFSILPLYSPGEFYSMEESEKMFESLESDAGNITKMLGRGIVSRSVGLFDKIEKSIRVFTSQLARMLGNRRQADQIGTLLAGRWMFEKNVAPMAHEAKSFIEERNIPFMISSSVEKTDEELCLDEILSYKVDISDGVNRSKISISMCILFWCSRKMGFNSAYKFPGADEVGIFNELNQVGLKLIIKNDGKPYLRIASGHSIIKRMLRDTAWSIVYSELLRRLPYSTNDLFGPDWFGGVKKRYIEISLEEAMEIRTEKLG